MRALLLGGLFVVSACGTDLGPCDMAAATVSYEESGLSLPGGQALLVTSCGGDAFCHGAPAGRLAERYGAPLEIDLALLPSARTFAEAQRTVREHAELVYSEVERGAMPPLDASLTELYLRTAETGPRFRIPASVDPARPRLPDIGSEQGLAMLRNWLSCGAPMP